MDIIFKWKDDESIVVIDENEKELRYISLSDIKKVGKKYEYWIDENNADLIHFVDGLGSAAMVTRSELLKNLEDFFAGDIAKSYTQKEFWDYVMIENFSAWIDIDSYMYEALKMKN